MSTCRTLFLITLLNCKIDFSCLSYVTLSYFFTCLNQQKTVCLCTVSICLTARKKYFFRRKQNTCGVIERHECEYVKRETVGTSGTISKRLIERTLKRFLPEPHHGISQHVHRYFTTSFNV